MCRSTEITPEMQDHLDGIKARNEIAIEHKVEEDSWAECMKRAHQRIGVKHLSEIKIPWIIRKLWDMSDTVAYYIECLSEILDTHDIVRKNSYTLLPDNIEAEAEDEVETKRKAIAYLSGETNKRYRPNLSPRILNALLDAGCDIWSRDSIIGWLAEREINYINNIGPSSKKKIVEWIKKGD